MNAAKGKRQVSLTLTVEDHDRLLDLARETDRTLAGYIRWVLKGYLRELDEKKEIEPSASCKGEKFLL